MFKIGTPNHDFFVKINWHDMPPSPHVSQFLGHTKAKSEKWTHLCFWTSNFVWNRHPATNEVHISHFGAVYWTTMISGNKSRHKKEILKHRIPKRSQLSMSWWYSCSVDKLYGRESFSIQWQDATVIATCQILTRCNGILLKKSWHFKKLLRIIIFAWRALSAWTHRLV